jgi:hypothetical protein
MQLCARCSYANRAGLDVMTCVRAASGVVVAVLSGVATRLFCVEHLANFGEIQD